MHVDMVYRALSGNTSPRDTGYLPLVAYDRTYHI